MKRIKYEEYGYTLFRNGKKLNLEMAGERGFTVEETIDALEWLAFELKLRLREGLEEENENVFNEEERP